MVLASQTLSVNTTRSLQLEIPSPRQRVAQSNIQETVMSPKRILTKRNSTKQETTNLNVLSSSEDKSYSTEAIPWSSLPASLLRPGKVHCNFLSPSLWMINIIVSMVIHIPISNKLNQISSHLSLFSKAMLSQTLHEFLLTIIQISTFY